jgi:hypothetical protein
VIRQHLNSARKFEWVVRSKPVKQLTPQALSYDSVEHINCVYPNFRKWYFEKMLPDVATGARAIFACIEDGRLSGVVIAKRGSEKKLCSLWVNPSARSAGLAAALAYNAFNWLGTQQPLFTVPEERLPEFRGLLNLWKFGEGTPVLGYYRHNKIEHVFNGRLVPSLAS